MTAIPLPTQSAVLRLLKEYEAMAKDEPCPWMRAAAQDLAAELRKTFGIPETGDAS